MQDQNLNEDFIYLFVEEIYLLKTDRIMTENTSSEEVIKVTTNEEKTTLPNEKAFSMPVRHTATSFVFLIIVMDRQKENLSIEERTFLNKMLQAIGVEENNFEVLNLAFLPEKTTISQLKNQYSSTVFLLFGVSEQQVSVQEEDIFPYFLQEIEKQLLIFAEPLFLIAQDNTRKRKMWNVLQKVQNYIA